MSNEESKNFDKTFENFLKKAKKKFGKNWPMGLETLVKCAFAEGWSAGAKECMKVIQRG